MTFKIVKLSEIDDQDISCRITTETDDVPLKESIKLLGVLNPPILFKNTSKYAIVSGFRRIRASRELGLKKLEARVLNPKTSKLEAARLAVADNALQRPLNLVEKSRAVGMLSAVIEDETILIEELGALGIPEGPAMIRKLKNIGNFSADLQKALLSGTVSLPTALELNGMNPEASGVFIKIFSQIKLSLGKQREIITLTMEIAHRENITVRAVFEENRLREILNHPNFDQSQKVQNIRYYLKKRRFPTLSATEKAFEQLIKELKLGSKVKLIPPNHFEGSTYTLTFNFRKLSELCDHKTAFDAILKNPMVEKFLK